MTLTTEQLSQIKADIAARKAMPEYGESVEGNIERLRVIGETRSHFSTETVEMLVRALEEKSRALADAERERDDWVEHSRKMEYRAIEAKEKLANLEAQPDEETKNALEKVISENWRMRDVLRQLLNNRPGGVYFNKWESVILEALNAPVTDACRAAMLKGDSK